MSDFNTVQLDKILFLDIETVPQFNEFKKLPAETQLLWEKKATKISENERTAADVYNKAGIYSEFGKIICISVGFLKRQGEELVARVKSFYGDDEKVILENFNAMVIKYFNSPETFLCAHNGKEFDFPYIARRTLINGLSIPHCLDTRGQKPWEIRHFDTLELWRFGDYKSYTSLELLTHVFNIPTPKDDIAGDQVCKIYWEDKDLQRIATYCQKDVVAIIQLFLRYKNLPIIKPDKILVAD